MITMNKKILMLCVSVFAIAIFLTGCASNPDAPPALVAMELESSVNFELLEHKGTALGLNDLPVWVQTYVETGITGLERMPDFAEDYCFVGETKATNLNAAQAWVDGFNIPQTIARNVSTRVEGVFTGATSGTTDGAYGTYFENVVKTTTDTEYSGARKINDWWVLQRRYDPDVKNKYEDEYSAFVLYTIPRDLLDQQVLTIIDNVAQESSLDADQEAAVNRAKELIAESGL